MTSRAKGWLIGGGVSLLSWVAIIGLAGLLWASATVPSSAQSANALVGWMCKTSQPTGWCPVSSTNPLPVATVSGGSPLDVNVSQWGGTATTLGQKAAAASLPVVIASDQMTTGAPTTGGSALPTKSIIYDSSAAAVTYLASINGGTPITTTGNSFLNIPAGQATTTVKSGAGVLKAIIFNGPATATSTMIIYDNTAGSGTVIGRPLGTAAAAPVTLNYNDLAFSTGLTIVTATANGADMTVVYR